MTATGHVQVEITSVSTDGEMMGTCAQGPVIVPGTIPGETVEAQLRPGARFQSALRADLRRVLVASPHRVAPACRHIVQCGGCSWQHITYTEQLRLKTDIVARVLAGALGSRVPNVQPTLASPGSADTAPWGYRNKAHFVVADEGGRLLMGHYRRGTKRVLPVEECPVHAPDGNRIAFAIRDELVRGKVPAVNAEVARGVVRHVIVRAAQGTPERMVTLVVRSLDKRAPAAAARAIGAGPSAPSLHLNLHEERSSYLLGPTTKTIAGRDRMREDIGEVSYLVSPGAFFQTNVAAARVMVDLVLAAIPTSATTVLDLYSGAGLFSLPLAKRGHKVVAIEENAIAVADGVAARRLNGLDEARCRFLVGRVDTVLDSPRVRVEPDAIVLDPPRSGCEPRVLTHVFERLRPRHVAYVSCDPASLARDLAEVQGAGYSARLVQPLDMFPHTTHIETVVHLTRDA